MGNNCPPYFKKNNLEECYKCDKEIVGVFQERWDGTVQHPTCPEIFRHFEIYTQTQKQSENHEGSYVGEIEVLDSETYIEIKEKVIIKAGLEDELSGQNDCFLGRHSPLNSETFERPTHLVGSFVSSKQPIGETSIWTRKSLTGFILCVYPRPTMTRVNCSDKEHPNFV